LACSQRCEQLLALLLKRPSELIAVALIALRLQLLPLIDDSVNSWYSRSRMSTRAGSALRSASAWARLNCMSRSALDAEVRYALQLAGQAQARARPAIIHLVGSHWYQRMPLR
jgi:hypothetical protein